MFNPIIYTPTYCWTSQIIILSPRLQKLHVDSLEVLHWVVFLKIRPVVKQNNAEFTNVCSFTLLLMCSTHFTLSRRILLLPLPPATIISSLYILKSPESLPGRSCLGPFSVVCFFGNWRSSELDLVVFWTSDIRTFVPCAGSSCILLFCLYLVSCTQKMFWRVHSLADTVPPYLTILVSSKQSKEWGTGLPYLHPS